MMQALSDAEIAAHNVKMDRLRAQMPEDVLTAIRVLGNWIDLPDTWDETVDRKEAAVWWTCQRVKWDKPCKPRGDDDAS